MNHPHLSELGATLMLLVLGFGVAVTAYGLAQALVGAVRRSFGPPKVSEAHRRRLDQLEHHRRRQNAQHGGKEWR